MDTHSVLLTKIITDQESIIGPLATDLAKSVNGIAWNQDGPQLTGDAQNVVSDLVKVFSTLFGKASIEVCHDSVRAIDPELAKRIFA